MPSLSQLPSDCAFKDVNKNTGKITVKKKTRKGTYKIRIKVTAKETADYKRAERTVAVKVKIK